MEMLRGRISGSAPTLSLRLRLRLILELELILET